MKLIFGLGNPGREYALSRHNVGFMCVNHLAKAHALTFSQRQARSQIAQGQIAGVEVVLVKPRTFMNRSGLAVASLVQRWSLPLSDLLIIYDDMDLPLGKLRLRPKGSAGGHHGMESIISALGSQDFPRLRVGIGRSGETGRAVSHVLGNFMSSEKAALHQALGQVAEAVVCLLTQGLEKAMSQYNRDG